MVTAFSSYWTDVKAWAAKPYTSDMNAWSWVLFLGLVSMALLAWSVVIHELLKQAE